MHGINDAHKGMYYLAADRQTIAVISWVGLCPAGGYLSSVGLERKSLWIEYLAPKAV
jgi:hypothetical protein